MKGPPRGTGPQEAGRRWRLELVRRSWATWTRLNRPLAGARRRSPYRPLDGTFEVVTDLHKRLPRDWNARLLDNEAQNLGIPLVDTWATALDGLDDADGE